MTRAKKPRASDICGAGWIELKLGRVDVVVVGSGDNNADDDDGGDELKFERACSNESDFER